MAQFHPTVDELVNDFGFALLPPVGMDTESYYLKTKYGFIRCNLKANAVGHEWWLHQVGATSSPDNLFTRDFDKASEVSSNIESAEELRSLIKILKATNTPA